MVNANGEKPKKIYLLEDSCEIVESERSAIIKLPFFFPESGNQLKLFVAEYDGSFFISDNGAAFRELFRRTNDPYFLDRIFEYLARVYLEIKPGPDKQLNYAFSDMRRFYRYLQGISLCSNADLCPAADDEQYNEYSEYTRYEEFPENPVYPDKFIEELRRSVFLKEIPFTGELICSPFTFSDEQCSMGILIEQNQNGEISLTDHGCFDGGDLIEHIKWNNYDDYHQFDAMINKICKRFDADYDGKKVRYILKNGKNSDLQKETFTFMQMMSILSELGVTVKTK